ncbi:MAG: DUF808 domain-containing protein [Myxococcales bacterium]
MAGGSLIALIDDIASILDDVALLTKVATKKTAGVLGDDLALNAQQVSGVKAERELPVVWAVAKGSARNKAILVPVALAISALAPWAVVPLLMFGGAYLCFEGCEKLAHKLLHPEEEDAEDAELVKKVNDPNTDLVALEKDKIKGAIRTDFILSAEIVTIALGTVASAPFPTQVSVLVGISALMTAGVYGIVASIVKLDDLGFFLYWHGKERGRSLLGRLEVGAGAAILRTAPYLMKGLSIAGTAAMFMVGGGILAHGIPGAEPWFHGLVDHVRGVENVGGLLALVLPTVLQVGLGIAVGTVAVLGMMLFQRVRGSK